MEALVLILAVTGTVPDPRYYCDSATPCQWLDVKTRPRAWKVECDKGDGNACEGMEAEGPASGGAGQRDKDRRGPR